MPSRTRRQTKEIRTFMQTVINTAIEINDIDKRIAELQAKKAELEASLNKS